MESLREKLHASAGEVETLAAELQETRQAVAARDELLRGEREINAETKERLSDVRAQAEEEARRAAAAETLAASEQGKQHVDHIRYQLCVYVFFFQDPAPSPPGFLS